MLIKEEASLSFASSWSLGGEEQAPSPAALPWDSSSPGTHTKAPQEYLWFIGDFCIGTWESQQGYDPIIESL